MHTWGVEGGRYAHMGCGGWEVCTHRVWRVGGMHIWGVEGGNPVVGLSRYLTWPHEDPVQPHFTLPHAGLKKFIINSSGQYGLKGTYKERQAIASRGGGASL